MWYLEFPARRGRAGMAITGLPTGAGLKSGRGPAIGAALLAALVAQPAAAVSYAYTFTITREAERVHTNFHHPIDYHMTDHPDVPDKIEPGWIDPAWLGRGPEVERVFGLRLGESARGSFSFDEADGTHEFSVGGSVPEYDVVWIDEKDDKTGDAAFKGSAWFTNIVLDFIHDDAVYVSDKAGELGSHTEVLFHPDYEVHYEETSPYSYHGYTTYFTFTDVERLSPSPREGGPVPRSSLVTAQTAPVPYGSAGLPEPTTMPLPAAPLFLLTGLGVLALLRRRA